MNRLKTSKPSWFVRSDLDGFFGLALDNLIQILVIVSLTQGVLQFPSEIVYGRVLPGAALSLMLGNFYYSWQAYCLAQQEGRDDLTALPYGISTVTIFAYIFLVMLPVRLDALSKGLSSEQAAELAWQAGIVASLGSGFLGLIGSWFANHLRQFTPRAALLSTLAGIALTFVTMGFVLRTYAHPLVGIVPFGVILLTYFGGFKFTLPGTRIIIPGGFVAVILGVILAWTTGLAHWDSRQFQQAIEPVGFHIPTLSITQIWASGEIFWNYLSIILPMTMFNLVGSLQNLESADAAGDSYPTVSSLAVDGIDSIVAGLFGSCFPTTLYIGHPGWKAMGARVGYSWLSGLVMGLLCLTGAVGILNYLIPIDCGMSIVLWIGIVIVSQSFTATKSEHAPAVVVGMLPGIAAWGALIIKNALHVAGLGTPERPFSPNLVAPFEKLDTYIEGAFALEQGVIFSAMILAAMTVYIIEQKFSIAAFWALVAAILSWIGLLHSYQWTIADTVIHLGWGSGAQWAIGYSLLALLLLYAQWQSKSN